MTATTTAIRICTNNFIGDDILSSATSTASGYDVANLYNPYRSKLWKSAGYFKITSSNCTFYFNDGSARTATLNTGDYTYATLITEIAAAAVRAGASATVVASADATAPYFWKLTFSTSVTLTLSTSTNAIWTTLGFTGSTNRTGTTFVADAAAAHSYEQITWNLGAARAPTFFGMIWPIDEVCPLSTSATLTLMASNIDSWDSPALSVTLTRGDMGVFEWLDSQSNTEYEYWALRITDPTNAAGAAGIKIGYAYLGDHTTLATRANVGIGFSKSWADESTVDAADGGQQWAREVPKRRKFKGTGIGLLDASDRYDWEQALFNVSKTRPFFVSLDPALEVSDDAAEYTLFAYLDGEPTWQHVIRDIYSLSFDLVEAG